MEVAELVSCTEIYQRKGLAALLGGRRPSDRRSARGIPLWVRTSTPQNFGLSSPRWPPTSLGVVIIRYYAAKYARTHLRRRLARCRAEG